MTIPKQGSGSEPILMQMVIVCLVSGFMLLFAGAMTTELQKRNGRRQ
jgi:hypothetical protein